MAQRLQLQRQAREGNVKGGGVGRSNQIVVVPVSWSWDDAQHAYSVMGLEGSRAGRSPQGEESEAAAATSTSSHVLSGHRHVHLDSMDGMAPSPASRGRFRDDREALLRSMVPSWGRNGAGNPRECPETDPNEVPDQSLKPEVIIQQIKVGMGVRTLCLHGYECSLYLIDDTAPP